MKPDNVSNTEMNTHMFPEVHHNKNNSHMYHVFHGPNNKSARTLDSQPYCRNSGY